MKNKFPVFVILLCLAFNIQAQNLEQLWQSPPADSRSWTFWYWMNGAVTKEGITADLEAMKENDIAGAYLMPIRGIPEKPFIEPIVEQLSPLWWQMVDFAFNEADRLGVKIAFHICDGFALAGGPWITPELSMQKVVWSELNIKGNQTFKGILPQPESYKGYYQDIAIFAFPSPEGEGISTEIVRPKVTVDIPDMDVQFLADRNNKTEILRSEAPCKIIYAFEEPFTCRSLQIQRDGNNFQSQRFLIEASEDGITYRKITKLEPPRQGWQDLDFPMTHSIPETTARYFRFSYDKAGTEPGAEDLDAAKWKQTLKIKGIWLSSAPRIHQYEGKNGEVWRVAPRTTIQQIPDALCINPEQIIDLSSLVDAQGNLEWKAPKGNWTILRMGHTSTGHTNATGGKGAGLECDKFNPEAIRLQFNSWFGKAVEVAGPEIAARVLKVFHVDSWECGSQNWSPVFREEFKQRRGYDLYEYLPIMAGFPVKSADISERFLYDVRNTIAELVVDKFFKVLQEEAHAKGCQFSAENVSPTMLSDGMMHYKNTDIPMGEFWLQSPTHDKPNDMLDAISGAHIYGKNIVQAEAFTQLRTMFTEHPGMLKSLQDREYAMGFNRLSYHVYVLNPWLDRKPGMTLDGIGLLFQRDQTWWKPGRTWVDYAQRCQALLQFGKPVIDLAVFTGEELPRRAILPDRLVPFIPGIFGEKRVQEEKLRLANVGEPTVQMPEGVNHSANIAYNENWVNSLRGYMYDSFNPDVLQSAEVKNGNIVLPGGAEYAALIIPGKHPMQPDPERMSIETAKKIFRLIREGATIFVDEVPRHTLGLSNYTEDEALLQRLFGNKSFYETTSQTIWNIEKGKLIRLPYTENTFDKINLSRDFIATDSINQYADGIGYIHRKDDTTDIYFISNQYDYPRQINISLRVEGKQPELWDPVTEKITIAGNWKSIDGRTELPIRLDACESVFIVLRNKQTPSGVGSNWFTFSSISDIKTPWKVQFDSKSRGPEQPVIFNQLTDWSKNDDERIRYYSGTAVYHNQFDWKTKIKNGERIFLSFENIANLADIKINGIPCGIIWTKPYRVDITDALKKGKNTIEIAVTNTWANRIMGDEDFNAASPDSTKNTWTNARYRLKNKVLAESGLTGKVELLSGSKK